MSTTVRDNPDEHRYELLEDVRRRGWQLRPFCPYVKAYIAEHPEYPDLVPEGQRARFRLSGS